MNYTADSWFFIQLSKGARKALDIWNDVKTGKSRMVVPSIVIVEVTKRLLSYGLNKYAEEIIDELESSYKITIVDLNLELAKNAGRLGNTYNSTTADAIILATAIETGYTNLLTDDIHFVPAEKHGKIKIVRFD